jgi:hypothetical protein
LKLEVVIMKDKAVPMLNLVQSHEKVWRGGGIAPTFLTTALDGCG